MEKIVEIEEVVKYKGHCPTCGAEQIDEYQFNVDIDCNSCRNTERESDEKKFKEKMSFLINSKVVDFEHDKYEIFSIVLEADDNKRYKIGIEYGYDHDANLSITELDRKDDATIEIEEKLVEYDISYIKNDKTYTEHGTVLSPMYSPKIQRRIILKYEDCSIICFNFYDESTQQSITFYQEM